MIEKLKFKYTLTNLQEQISDIALWRHLVSQDIEQLKDKINEIIDHLPQEKEDLVYKYKGGEDDGYGGVTAPITWKEAYEEQERYESWAMKEMKDACDKIKAHPEWTYGENAYPSPYERAIVAGCGQAVKQLQEELIKAKQPTKEVPDIRHILERLINCPRYENGKICIVCKEKLNQAIREINDLYKR